MVRVARLVIEHIRTSEKFAHQDFRRIRKLGVGFFGHGVQRELVPHLWAHSYQQKSALR
jgi:hypothetical protein